MEIKNILNIKSRNEFRNWLLLNHDIENECYVPLIKKEDKASNNLYYIDAVYEALCFGWIDNRQQVIDNTRYVRISKRVKNSHFNEINKERSRLLIKQGLMHESGYKTLPDLNKEFIIPENIIIRLKEENVYDRFISYPLLYQKIRISYIVEFKDKEKYKKALDHLIIKTKENKLIGMWNDNGRLL